MASVPMREICDVGLFTNTSALCNENCLASTSGKVKNGTLPQQQHKLLHLRTRRGDGSCIDIVEEHAMTVCNEHIVNVCHKVRGKADILSRPKK